MSVGRRLNARDRLFPKIPLTPSVTSTRPLADQLMDASDQGGSSSLTGYSMTSWPTDSASRSTRSSERPCCRWISVRAVLPETISFAST